MSQLFDLKTLEKQVGPKAIEFARNSMDVMSVSNMKLTAGTRLEAAVKPAPPSKDPAAYVKLTVRGSRFAIDCRHHGKGKWCLHALILALHHLGQKPIYRQEAPKKTTPKLGFRWTISAFEDRWLLRIRSMSGSGIAAHKKTYLTTEHRVLGISKNAAHLIADLSEDERDGLSIARNDMATILESLDKLELYNGNGELLKRERWNEDVPSLKVRLHKGAIHWELDQSIDNLHFFPGWPGYLMRDTTLFRCPGYVPDFEHLRHAKNPIPISGESLAPFMAHRHRIEWLNPKPPHTRYLESVGLEFNPKAGDLEGNLGLWHEGHFYPLNNLDDSRQILMQDGRRLFLDINTYELARFRDQAQKARLPLQGASVFVHGPNAQRFLESSQLPQNWRIEREQADHFFGLNPMPVETLWKNGQPQYRIGDAVYDHHTLAQGIQGNGRNVKLDNGQLLSIDIGAIARNTHILRGVDALHEDEAQKENLLARIRGEEVDKPQLPELDQRWQQTLRPYQMEGVDWMRENLSRNEPALLADDMGLGKTIQTLALLESVANAFPQLIILPRSLVANWQEEANRFTPKRKITVHHGAKRAKDAETLQKADLILTTYGTVLRDAEMLYDVQFGIVVLDEAQAIKNPSSRTAQAIFELWRDAAIALTGTPVENRITELWSIFQFLAPGYLGEEEEMKLVTTPGMPAFEALRSKVKPFIKRRLKEDVAKELPPKQEVVIRLPMSDQQEKLYGDIRRNAQDILQENGKSKSMNVLTQLLRLRQACCHPGLVSEMALSQPSNKFDFLLEHLSDITESGHAALVFSQFTSLLGLLKHALEEQEMPYLYLDGQTQDRQALVHRFQDGEAPVFLISLKAGGTGLNLTRASYVYHLDPWWNPAVEAQATDRAHRIGQEKKVFSYKIVSQGTIEERILQLQKSKKALADGLFTDPDKLFQSLDVETLMNLI